MALLVGVVAVDGGDGYNVKFEGVEVAVGALPSQASWARLTSSRSKELFLSLLNLTSMITCDRILIAVFYLLYLLHSMFHLKGINE